MARAYDVAIAALALDVERKWLDNLTSQHSVPGTEHFARGTPRRLAMRALVTAAIVRDLNRVLGVSVARAVAIAGQAIDQPEDGRTPTAITPSISLGIDVARLEREIDSRLLLAMETAVPRRRGRPPRKERRGTQ